MCRPARAAPPRRPCHEQQEQIQHPEERQPQHKQGVGVQCCPSRLRSRRGLRAVAEAHALAAHLDHVAIVQRLPALDQATVDAVPLVLPRSLT